MTEIEKLEERFYHKRQLGLLDVKFSFHGITEDTTAEELAAEVNACFDAIDAGQVGILDFNDSRWKSA